MKNRLAMLCAPLIAATLTGCGTIDGSGGPTISASIGYGGINGSISWTPKPKPLTLEESGSAFNTLTGKSPVSAKP